jgi:ABC-type multidrug transport system fused ATPase/permease subunit
MKMISELKKEHTIIIINNDIKTIKNKFIDKSILFLNGKIIGDGKYSDLMLNNKEYHELVKKI